MVTIARDIKEYRPCWLVPKMKAGCSRSNAQIVALVLKQSGCAILATFQRALCIFCNYPSPNLARPPY